jgi:isocitrate/isopropylmalate dehydrogenase
MFEPVHGSAPKYAGKNTVNPIATILAAKMMLDYLNESEAAGLVEKAVNEVLKEGKVRTYDLGGNSSTQEMAVTIADKVSFFAH